MKICSLQFTFVRRAGAAGKATDRRIDVAGGVPLTIAVVRRAFERLQFTAVMAREIDVGSFECDCGHQSHFGEGTIWSMREMSRRRGREVGLGSSELPSHGIIFSGGSAIAMRCPKLGRLPMENTRARPHAGPARRALRANPPYTAHQGQFLAFIHLYTKLHRRPPAEVDIAGYFNVSPPAVHSMVLTLQRRGLISRQSGETRSIHLLIDTAALPPLE